MLPQYRRQRLLLLDRPVALHLPHLTTQKKQPSKEPSFLPTSSTSLPALHFPPASKPRQSPFAGPPEAARLPPRARAGPAKPTHGALRPNPCSPQPAATRTSKLRPQKERGATQTGEAAPSSPQHPLKRQ
jgi:hypothetical protein